MSNCMNSYGSRANGCASSFFANNRGSWCSDCGNWANNGCGCWANNGCGHDAHHGCLYSRWMHPICSNQAYYTCAGTQNGATLVIHQIALEAGGEQSCTPRNFQLRITGPSYPCGEVFTLRAGSCIELDEPLVISGLEPGQYRIELLYNCDGEFISTITGPVCGQIVTVSDSAAPTVVTIVNRWNLHRCRRSCNCAGY